jgi:hypothetical protein
MFLLLAPTSAFADGGRLRIHAQAGPFTVSLFTTPDPLRVGQADFSAAIERRDVDGLEEDAQVTFVLTPEDGHGTPIALRATRAAATSRFLDAANFSLPHSGIWRVTVLVQKGADFGQCSTEVDVLPATLISNDLMWEIAIVPLAVLLFILHQWRKYFVSTRRCNGRNGNSSTRRAGS